MNRAALREYLERRPRRGRLPPSLETAFLSDRLRRTTQIKRVAMVMGIALYAAFAPLDWWSAPNSRETIWAIRFGFVIPLVTLGLVASFIPRLRKYLFEICGFVIVVGGMGLVMMLVVTRSDEPAYLTYGAGLVLVFLFEVFAGLRFVHAAVINVSVLIAYNLLAVFFQDVLSMKDGFLALLNNNYQFISAAFIGALPTYLSENLARQEFAQRLLVGIEQVEKRRLVEQLAEQRLNERTRVLEAANQHKSEFLANMSHELRTPLNAVIGFSEVLSERLFGDLNPRQARYIENIHSSGRHLLSLINDILDLSKIEAGRMELEITRFSAPAALDSAATLLRERATRTRVRLDIRVDPAVGEIHADERKFKQIVLNLLSNAVKFTPPDGQVSIAAGLVGTTLEVSIEDTGIGIDPANHELIFEQFRQVGTDYTRKREGTGLGLALTKKFVELHGGIISVRSAPGQGSCFTFTIPAHDAPPSQPADAAEGTHG